MILISFLLAITGYLENNGNSCVVLPKTYSPNCQCAQCPLCTPIQEDCKAIIVGFILYKEDSMMLNVKFEQETRYYYGLQKIEDEISNQKIPIGSYTYDVKLKENSLDIISIHKGYLTIIY